MQIIIPMSGHGNRFLAKGYKEIKPLIPVDGKPIIEHVIRLFPGETNFVFICSNEHLEATPLAKTLMSLMPTGRIVGIEPHKKGPVWAVLKAANEIEDDEPTIVNYCDFNCVWDYRHFKQTVLAGKYDGAIPCYIGFHPHLLGPNFYASCRVDEQKHLLEIREKYSFTENKMDCHQSSGTYYFGSGKLVKRYFQKLIEEDINLNGEYYVSLVYNILVLDALRVLVYEIDKFCQWGTPEDLEEFMTWLRYFKHEEGDGQHLPSHDPRTYSYWKEYFQLSK